MSEGRALTTFAYVAVEPSGRKRSGFVEAPDKEGKVQRWSLEWGGAAQLAGQGVNQQTLKVGDHIVITGRPSRAPGEYRVLVQTISRPSDGFVWGRGRGEVVD